MLKLDRNILISLSFSFGTLLTRSQLTNCFFKERVSQAACFLLRFNDFSLAHFDCAIKTASSYETGDRASSVTAVSLETEATEAES